jgi:hypothetical protein
MNKIPPKPIQPIAKPPAPVIISKLFPDPIFDGEVTDSIIHPHFHGFNLITGFRGKGKSTLAMSWDNPNNIIMLDFEGKEESGAAELGIKAYFPIMKEVLGKMGPSFDSVQVYNRTLQIVESIPEGRFTTLVIDNAQEFQESCCRHIEIIADKDPETLKRVFGLKQKNVQLGSYGGALPGAKRLIANLIRLAAAKGIKVVSTTFQLRPAWVNNQPAFNKWKTTDVSIWHEESKLTLVMTDPLPRYFPTPRAYVMKENLPLRAWDSVKKQTLTIRRIPAALPQATSQTIYDYLDRPANFKEPREGETVTALEIAPFTTSFSNEQLYQWQQILKLQKELGISGEGENNGL